MTSYCILPAFALMIGCLAFPGPVPRSGCLLSQVNSSHPVQALLESFTVLSGCASKGTAGLPQEVHILNVRNSEDFGHHERESLRSAVPFNFYREQSYFVPRDISCTGRCIRQTPRFIC